MTEGLDKLCEAFDKMPEVFYEERRELMEAAGEKMYRQVLKNIDADTKEKTGNLRAACYKHIGSRGGYAAVRNNHRKAPHAHLVEYGHKLVKGAKTKTGKRGQKVNVKGSGRAIGWVSGKHMYRNALNELEDELMQEAEALADRLVGDLF